MRKKNNIFTHLILSIFTLLLSTQILFSQRPVDTGFNAFPSLNLTDTSTFNIINAQMVLQPDGKILATGNFTVMNGKAVDKVVRINTDGTIDNSFNCIECNSISRPSILLQDDGKVVVGGSRSPAIGPNGNISKLIRVNSDGSLDNSFSSPYVESVGVFTYEAFPFGQQSDGKLFVGRRVNGFGDSLIRVNRLNSNGSFDTSFQQFTTTIFSGVVRGSVQGLTQLSDGKIYVYGTTNFGPFARLNADGTEDTSYAKPTFTSQQNQPVVNEIIVQSDGKVIIAGYFNRVNGLSKANLTRLNPDGSVDPTFTDPIGTYTPPLEEFSDGSILINESFNPFLVDSLPKKLTADGSSNGTFNFPKDLTFVRNFLVDPNTDKIYIFGVLNNSEGQAVFQFARLNNDGSLDATFNNSVGNGAGISDLAVQADQKIIMVGRFDQINNIPQKNIARVNPDGTLDSTFNPPTQVRELPTKVVVAPNGQIYVVALFEFSARKLARLNSDGSLDTSFDVGIELGNIVRLQSDGQILVADGSTAKRFTTNGMYDTTFQPDLSSGSRVEDILVQSNGQIVIAGSLLFNETGQRSIGRYNNDGTLDLSFNAGSIGPVEDIEQLPNGQYLVSTDQLQRLNNDGSLDSTYVSPDFDYYTSQFSDELRFRLLPDQSIIAYGYFSRVNGNPTQFGLTRVLSDGTLSDTTFPNGTNSVVSDVEFQNDGQMLVGGSFTVIEKVSRPGIARLELPDLTQTVDYDFDGDGMADIAVFRPTENKWYVLRSLDFGVTQQVFGISGDSPAPADHDGDGVVDYAIYRNTQGDWWSLSSIAGNQVFAHLGQNGDAPRPSDFDGDGRADYIVYRPTDFTWYRSSSADGSVSNKQFGAAGDKPLVGDFDGDGKSDVAIYRPSTGDWWWQSSVDNVQRATHWGISSDIPAPGDYDGDGITDFAVYRPADGVWYVLNSSSGNTSATIIQFGISEDKPVPADYDGDGKTDIAVYRPSTGVWYLLRSKAGFQAIQFGISTDIPIPNALIP